MVDRPGTVTAAVVLTWLSAIGALLAGVLLIIFAGNADVLPELHAEEGTVRIVGIVQILIGLITAAVAVGLSRGSGISRTVVAVVMGLQVGGAIWAIIQFGSHHLTESLIQIAIACVVVALLYNANASAFFAGGARDRV